MKLEQTKKLVRLIRKHVESQVSLSWKGSEPPEVMVVIEAEARDAKHELFTYLAELTDTPEEQK